MNVSDGCTIVGDTLRSVPHDVSGHFVVPDGIACIGEHAFSERRVTSVHLPDSVTSIAYQAFASCRMLEKINIPESVTRISPHAFSECTSLTEIYLPRAIKSIGEMAFANCDNLTVVQGFKVNETDASSLYRNFDGCDIGPLAFLRVRERIDVDVHRKRLAMALAETRSGEAVESVGMHGPVDQSLDVDRRQPIKTL